MIKKYIGLFLLSLLSSAALMAQTKTGDQDQIELRKERYLKGLRKLSSKQEIQRADSITKVKGIDESDINTLSSKYEKIHRYAFSEELNSAETPQVADIYVDNDFIVRAKVLRPATKEEQKQALDDLRKLINEVTPQSIAREKVLAEQLNKPAPLFSLEDVDGNKHDLSQLKGKVVVLNFWFIGCAPCKKEMPHLNTLVKEFKGKDVVFLAFEVNNNDASKVKAVTKNNFDYVQIPTTRKDLPQLYKISTYPTSYVIDQKGIVRYALAGYNPFKLPEIGRTIERLLKGKK